MARGYNYGEAYVSNFSMIVGGMPNIGTNSLAELVLSKNNVPYTGIGGDPLIGYDVRSQDCVSMLKLSLLAESNGSNFKEVYCGPDGVARLVEVGVTQARPPRNLLQKSVSSSFVNRVDHVIIKARQSLPIRYHKGSINVMGNGSVQQEIFNCILGYVNKTPAVGMEAWAEFERSQQSEITQQMLKDAVRRSEWESLVGYKMTIADIPPYASFSVSQTTPRNANIPVTNAFDAVVQLSLGNSTPDAGGIVDIAGVTSTGAQVLDLVKGSDLLSQFPEIQNQEPLYSFTDNDYYVLLDHECNLNAISRGKNWNLFPGDGTGETGYLQLSRSSTSRDAILSFNGLDTNTFFFRRLNGEIVNIKQMIEANEAAGGGGSPLSSLAGVATSNPFRGEIVTGIDDGLGVEISELILSYTIAKPSIQIRSPFADAYTIARNVAAGGVHYTPIVIKEEPAGVGYNGRLVLPIAPPDEEGVAYDQESEIDELEGTVIDITAPFLSNEGAVEFSANLYATINGDTGQTETFVYEGGGYDILPGMRFPENNGVVQSVEFIYADKDSVTTNVVTGPKYVPIGSYSESTYIKRSESITASALVVAGSNAEGIFIVDVDGRGRYQAINSLLEPIYPGDKVEVRLINVPIEKD